MKISYNNYPVLKYLKNGSLNKMVVHEFDYEDIQHISEKFTHSFNKNASFFKSEINIIQQPFAEACAKSHNKLVDLYNDIMGNDMELKFCGTYIFGDTIHMINHDTEKGNPFLRADYFAFHKMGFPLYFMSVNENNYIFWISRFMNKTKDEFAKFIQRGFGFITVLRMFKSYASVETKLLKPKQKLKEISCKYLNETDFDVTFLDSKWFTTLVKSGEFNVRGHFRLQPKKVDDKWTKELIWISEFKKTGYTAPAKKLTYNETKYD